jgi:hypothetical protein
MAKLCIHKNKCKILGGNKQSIKKLANIFYSFISCYSVVVTRLPPSTPQKRSHAPKYKQDNGAIDWIFNYLELQIGFFCLFMSNNP